MTANLEKAANSDIYANSDLLSDDFDSAEDRRLLRKVDLRYYLKFFGTHMKSDYGVYPPAHRLLPILTLLYLLSFLDRSVSFYLRVFKLSYSS